MQQFEYIRCHGSGNRFVMIDAVRDAERLAQCDPAALARAACRLDGGTDGLLLLVGCGAEYGMRMFNPDGSEAEMCGNGIRCVARLAHERYGTGGRFALWSGGRRYDISHLDPLPGAIPVYGAVIPVGRASADFAGSSDGLTGAPLPELDPDLSFTFLDLGNPHLVARVDAVDFDLLRRLGERVVALRSLFPRGVNVSLFRCDGRRDLFVATYERGAGITESCGTAMTASSTAACLLGACDYDAELRVRNRGGMVRCCCTADGGLRTLLAGNATFEADGAFRFDGAQAFPLDGAVRLRGEEIAAYDAFRAGVASTASR
ncbi:MAG: diaminopimelate epimerase [Alistipes sp.]|nr:diaminopimelate epimerase [Alistipes sp.]